MNASITQMPVMQFPHEEDLTLTLRLRTASVEDREYFFLQDGSINPGFLADCFDIFDMISSHIVTINGKTLKELVKEVQGEISI